MPHPGGGLRLQQHGVGKYEARVAEQGGAVVESVNTTRGGPLPPGWPQRRWNAALGAAASETMWTLLAQAPAGAVLESCWPNDFRDFVTRGLSRANSPKAVEIWCDVPVETARRRFEARHPRHPIHGDPLTDDEWERWRHTARPLRVGPTLHVNTTRPVDVKTILAWIHDPEHRRHPNHGPEDSIHRS